MNLSSYLSHLSECVREATYGAPMTKDEAIDYQSLVAAEMARAESRRRGEGGDLFGSRQLHGGNSKV